jgi:hypothetical protein
VSWIADGINGRLRLPPAALWPWPVDGFHHQPAQRQLLLRACGTLPAIGTDHRGPLILFGSPLKRMRDERWAFVCRRKKNCRFNAQPRRTSRRPPSWAECGWRSGGLKGLVVRYGKKDAATKRLTLSAWKRRVGES